MSIRRFASFLAAAAVVFFASETSGRSLRDELVGNWTLVSWQRVINGVPEPGPFGPTPVGRHVFTEDGIFCTASMAPDRPKFASPDVLSANQQESSSAFGSFIAYCGRYETIESERVLLLHPDVSWFPNWTGTTLRRAVEIEGDRATFRFRAPGTAEKNTEGVFVWQRVK